MLLATAAADVIRIKRQVDQALDIRGIIRLASGEALDLKPMKLTCGT